MADQWIVSDYTFKRQKSLQIATEEMRRLAALHPEKKFRIYRVKPTLNPSASKQMLADQAAEIERLKGELHALRQELVTGWLPSRLCWRRTGC